MVTNDLQSSLSSVFSIMSSTIANEALDEILQAYVTEQGQFSSRIKWAEFDSEFCLVRSGLSDFSSFFTEIYSATMAADDELETVSSKTTDEDIKMLVDHANQYTVRAGHFTYASHANVAWKTVADSL